MEYLSGLPLGSVPGLTYKDQSRLERPAGDKHSSLFRPRIQSFKKTSAEQRPEVHVSVGRDEAGLPARRQTGRHPAKSSGTTNAIKLFFRFLAC